MIAGHARKQRSIGVRKFPERAKILDNVVISNELITVLFSFNLVRLTLGLFLDREADPQTADLLRDQFHAWVSQDPTIVDDCS